MTLRFSSEVFSSVGAFRHYLEASPAIPLIIGENCALHEWSSRCSLDESLFSSPHRRIYFNGVFRVFQVISSYLCERYSFFCRHFSTSEEASNSLANPQVRWIQRTINQPNEEGKKLESFPPIFLHQVFDSKIRVRLIGQRGVVTFQHTGGICRGMVDWFLYLYFRTQHQFENPRTHLFAVSKQFVNGGGEEATLLQSMIVRNGKLLGLRFGTQSPKSRKLRVPRLKYTVADWNRSTPTVLITAFEQLPPGAYRIGVTIHAMALIKVNSNLAYLFDPNQGVLEINGEGVGRVLYSMLNRSLPSNESFSRDNDSYSLMHLVLKIFLACQFCSVLEFIPVAPRHKGGISG